MEDNVHRPLAVYRVRLTTADALAFEQLRRELTTPQKAALMAAVVLTGGAVGFLDEASGMPWWLLAAGLLLVQAIIGFAARAWLRQRRAKARAALHGEVEVEEWGDHLAIRSRAGTMFLAYETIGNVIEDGFRVFILYPGGAVILPQRAFPDRQAMRAFAQAIDRRSMDAAP